MSRSLDTKSSTVFLSAIALIACGGSDPSEPKAEGTGGASSGGSEPGDETGGQRNASSGGTSSEGPSDEGHCSDEISADAFGLYPYYMKNCADDSAGLDLSGSPSPWVKSIILEEPLAPGETWAFSTLVVGGGPFELYGAKEECGEALELLDSTTEALGQKEAVICLEAAPQQDTYTHLVWVWHSGSEHTRTALCPGGMCPAE